MLQNLIALIFHQCLNTNIYKLHSETCRMVKVRKTMKILQNLHSPEIAFSQLRHCYIFYKEITDIICTILRSYSNHVKMFQLMMRIYFLASLGNHLLGFSLHIIIIKTHINIHFVVEH